jgi:hypothetical protein
MTGMMPPKGAPALRGNATGNVIEQKRLSAKGDLLYPGFSITSPEGNVLLLRK